MCTLNVANPSNPQRCFFANEAFTITKKYGAGNREELSDEHM